MSTMSAPGRTKFCEVAPVTTTTVGDDADPTVPEPVCLAREPEDPVAEREVPPPLREAPRAGVWAVEPEPCAELAPVPPPVPPPPPATFTSPDPRIA